MKSTRLLSQIFYFGAVGITATIVNYVAALIFHEQLSVSLYTAQLLGYCLAVTISLLGHSKFTFRSQLTFGVFFRFVVVSLSTLGLSEFLLLCLESLLAISHRFSLLIVVCTIPVITYILSKLWVFQESKQAY
jgi:putative flippase GtrA